MLTDSDVTSVQGRGRVDPEVRLRSSGGTGLLPRWAIGVLVLCLCAGCGADRLPSDSAQGGPAIPDGIPRAGSSVVMTIPNASDTAGTLLGNVYSGFARDGRVFVANGAEHAVLEYDTTGTLLRRIGRAGHGPGEFMAIRWIALLQPDSLLVLDSELRRITVFDASGTYARSFTVELPEVGEPQWIAEHGSEIALSYSKGVDPRGLEDGGLARDSDVVVMIDRNPESAAIPVSSLPPLAGRWWQRLPAAGRYRLHAVEGGASPAVAAHGNVLIAASSDVQEVRRLDRNQWDVIPLRRQQWDNGEVEGSPGVPARLYDGLVVGPNGSFWLGDARLAQDSLRVWRVFDSTGTLTEAVLLPGTFRPWQVDSSWVLGRSEADDGSETVAIRRIREAEGTSGDASLQ